jgi:hypothetical protein
VYSFSPLTTFDKKQTIFYVNTSLLTWWNYRPALSGDETNADLQRRCHLLSFLTSRQRTRSFTSASSSCLAGVRLFHVYICVCGSPRLPSVLELSLNARRIRLDDFSNKKNSSERFIWPPIDVFVYFTFMALLSLWKGDLTDRGLEQISLSKLTRCNSPLVIPRLPTTYRVSMVPDFSRSFDTAALCSACQ